MIVFDRVSKRYEEGHDALREVSVTIDRDDMVFLTGHSGAGKSTLIETLGVQLVNDGHRVAVLAVDPLDAPPAGLEIADDRAGEVRG